MRILTTIILFALLALTAGAVEEDGNAPALAGDACASGTDSRWDAALADSYRRFLAPFSAADTMTALRMMPVDTFLAVAREEEPPLVLDVRTPGESGVLGITLPGSLAVPMDQVFTTEVLEKLQDRTVVVVCTAGHRATAVALALRHIGLDDVWILKGGTAALAAYLTPKTAY